MKNRLKLKQIGSMTAKGGFLNESDICKKFVNYKNDTVAQSWLNTLGYNPDKIENLSATQIPVKINHDKAIDLGVCEKKYIESIKFKKADIQIKIEILIDDIVHIENISLKKAKKSAGFNQVDKRAVSTYQKIWNFNDEISKWLQLFTGEILPKEVLSSSELKNIKDKRRLFFTDMPTDKVKMIIDFFNSNKILIISDILRGRGGLSAEWLLVTKNIDSSSIDWILKDINSVCNFYAQGEVKISPRGSLKIGRVTMQRKGGTPDPTSLQFKINPLELFEM